MDAKRLVALAAASVPDRIIDVIVALSYPTAFAVRPSSTAPGLLTSDEPRGGGRIDGFGIADADALELLAVQLLAVRMGCLLAVRLRCHGVPLGYRYSPYGSMYSRYGAGAIDYLGYGGLGYWRLRRRLVSGKPAARHRAQPRQRRRRSARSGRERPRLRRGQHRRSTAVPISSGSSSSSGAVRRAAPARHRPRAAAAAAIRAAAAPRSRAEPHRNCEYRARPASRRFILGRSECSLRRYDVRLRQSELIFRRFSHSTVNGGADAVPAPAPARRGAAPGHGSLSESSRLLSPAPTSPHPSDPSARSVPTRRNTTNGLTVCSAASAAAITGATISRPRSTSRRAAEPKSTAPSRPACPNRPSRASFWNTPIKASAVSVGQSYQFGRNALFHPFVTAGVDIERQRHEIERPAQSVAIYARSPLNPQVVQVTGQISIPALTRTETAVTVSPYAAAGFKAYFTERGFFRTDLKVSVRSGIDRVIWRAGFGVDF